MTRSARPPTPASRALQADHRRISGFCIGGGVSVSLICDIRIASENSKFGVPAARLGLGYRAAGIKTLMDVVGPSFAKEIFFTGRMFTAPEALAWG